MYEALLLKPCVRLSRESPQTISECSVSQDDSGHVSGGSRGATPEHKRTDSSYSQSSLPSTLSTVTDDDEDIDRVVAKVKQQAGSRSNLLSVFGDSRESIASYYSDAGDITYSNVPITGEILFSLNYNYKTSMLEVGIKQCREIAVADNRRNRSDPYVKTYLLPDRTRSGKRKTKVKKHTVNPTFEETLKYSITKSELENRTLWVTVWHNDRFGRNAFLGEVTINFDYFKFEDPFPKWYILQERMDAPPQSMMIYKGDISICIRYVPADKHNAPSTSTGKQKKENIKGQLQVMVKEARNLTAVRSNGFSDPFCKGYLLPERHKSSKQKTVVMRKDCNPVWNHTFVFEDVTLMELRERCLELTIWDYEKLTSNDFLGGVRLNLGTGMSQGKTVDWMDARGEEMSMWQAMLDRPNLWIDGALILRPNMDKRKF
ncbi:Sytl5p [Mactra antiquata]